MDIFPVKSEKSKGKQRATEPISNDNDTPSSRTLIIRFSEGIIDLTLAVTEQHDTVGDIKKRIRESRPELEARRLRLIHLGRILADDTQLYGLLAATDKKTQRRSNFNVGSENTLPVPPSPQADTTPVPTWIHCAIGPEIKPGDEDDAGRGVQVAQLQPARGFDRLVSLGFSESDVANFRQQFHNQSPYNYLDAEQDFETEEEYDEHARTLEERWIDSMDDVGTALVSRSATSTNSSLLQGVLVGFFFPLIPFSYFRKPTPAVFWSDGSEHETVGSVVFSKSMQMGIIIGFVANVSLGIWRLLFNP